MLVKGAVIKPTLKFVKTRHQEGYEEWLGALSAECREIMAEGLVSSWYPLRLAMVEPTEVIARLFYNGQEEVAWELGRFSADFALRGIYKIFVRLGSPQFIVRRASRVFTTYYTNAVLRVVDSGSHHAVVRILEFPEPHRLVDRRMGGFMERAVEISGARNVHGSIESSLTEGDPHTEFRFAWE